MKKFLLLSLIAILASCSSFNTTYTSTIIPTKEITSHDRPSEDGIKKCSPYVPADIPIVPLAPIALLAELKKNEYNKREQILIEYIETLRLHISKSRKSHQDNFKAYTAKCASE